MLRLHHLVARRAAGNRDTPGTRDARMAVDAIDLVLAEEELDSLGALGDDRLLVLHHARHVELDAGDLDALFGGLLRVLVQLGGVEDGLGGDAAAQRAGAAQPRVLLDAHRLEAQLPGADGGDIAARSCSDDRHVVLGHQVLRLQKGGWK